MEIMDIEGEDLVIRFPLSWAVGFAINTSQMLLGPTAETFGHSGWGGSFGFADPVTGIGVGYTMNYMTEPGLEPDPRIVTLYTAIYESLA